MEYNELIARAQRAPVDAPATDDLLAGMRRTLHRRRRQRQALLSAALLLVVCLPALFLQPHEEYSATLVEQVSRRLDTPPTHTPAPILGYRNSMYNRQIYTLL